MAAEVYDYIYKWNFSGVWLDSEAKFSKNLIIKFFPYDNSIELYDTDCNRMFLKRTFMETLTTEDMVEGNKITVYEKQIKITGYLDSRTKNYFEHIGGKSFVLLKPNVVGKLGEIINIIQDHKFIITRLRMYKLIKSEATEFYASMKGHIGQHLVIANTISGPVVAMQVQGENALERFKDVLGPEDPGEARKVAPTSLRAKFGEDTNITNGFHGSLTSEDRINDYDFFFSTRHSTPDPLFEVKNATCCLIKPHAVKDGNLGHIITSILQFGFQIAGAQMLYLSKDNIERLVEVYRGLVNDYHAFLLSYLGGACVVLAITTENDQINAHAAFRKFAGPSNPAVARQIRPNSLRAKYGCENYENAIHCTDVAEDTTLELEYLFRFKNA